MSFILDALKKSENERQKQSGPALYEVKVAPPQGRFPIWAVVVGVLLGVNLVVLIAVLLMREKQGTAVQATQASMAASAAAVGNTAGTAATAAGGTSPPPPAASPPSGTDSGAQNVPGVVSGRMQSTPATGATIGADGLPVATGAFQNAPVDSVTSGTTPPTRFNPPLVEEDPAAYEGASSPRGTPVNPADYMPATASAPAPATPQPSGYPMTAGGDPSAAPGGARPSNVRTASAIPSRDELVASGMGDLPPANLSLHVYDKSPAARFVFVNGQRAREGETLQNGLRIDEITAEGAVLSFRGSRFLVPLQ